MYIRWGCVLFVSNIGGTHYNMHSIILQAGWTALMEASSEGHLECVKELLDKGAQVNVQNEVSGCTVSPICMTCLP